MATRHELMPLVRNGLRGHVDLAHWLILFGLGSTVCMTYVLDKGVGEANKVWPYWPSKPPRS